MVRVEKSIEIRAPPERVWEMLALDRQAEWMDEWKSSEYTSEVRTPEDKYRVGASAHVTEKHGEFDLRSRRASKTRRSRLVRNDQ